jgi:hypothetical protein
MLFTVAYSFWDDLLDPMKVTFDGDNKLIIVNAQYSTITVKQDIYSASKRWLKRRQNFEYPRPMRSIGGDTLPNALYAGDIYFLRNYTTGNSLGNWRIVVDHLVNINGTIYNDNTAVSPYIIQSGGGVVATVSSQAYAYNYNANIVIPSASDVASQVWNTTPTGYPATSLAGIVNSTNQTVSNVATTTNNILAVSI